MSGAIQQDAHTNNGGTLEDTSDAFLNLWKDGASEKELPEDEEEDEDEGTPSDDDNEADASEETPEEDAEDSESDEETDEEPDEDDKKEPKRKVLDDKSVVKVKVNGEDLEVPVEKLKRLYGQEVALTQKSQEVAAKRKELEQEGARYVAATDALLTKAKERYSPYSQIDWLVAAKELSGEELTALRGEALKAYSDIEFLTKELDGVMSHVGKQRQDALVAEAQETLKELSDPVKGIKGFGQEMYQELHTWAVNAGVPRDVMNNAVSAPIIRILHKAMLYDKGTKVLQTQKTKGNKKPTKIVKGTVNSETNRKAFSENKPKDAMNRMKANSSMDNIADAFLAGWSNDK